MVAQRSAATKALLAGAVGAAVVLKQQGNNFVPAPDARAHTRLPVAAAAAAGMGAVATAGAVPAYADKFATVPAYADAIGDAAVRLTPTVYPFMKEVDWNSMIYLARPGTAGSSMDWLKAVDKAIDMGAQMNSELLKKAAIAHHDAILSIDDKGVLSKKALTAVDAALGRLIASVPEETTMGVYNSFKGLISPDVPEYLMSTVKAEDARVAYSGLLNFASVVKANPITSTVREEGEVLDKLKSAGIDEAAKTLSEASYPFLKEVDWLSDLYTRPLPGISAKDALKAVDKAIVMGASMDGKLLKEAAEAHHKAIASVDANGVTSQADYEAINAALGKAIASVPRSEVMDVYNAFAKITDPNIPGFMFSKIPKASDAFGAYDALLKFKDAVRAAEI